MGECCGCLNKESALGSPLTFPEPEKKKWLMSHIVEKNLSLGIRKSELKSKYGWCVNLKLLNNL